jgi:hypothetical protein
MKKAMFFLASVILLSTASLPVNAETDQCAGLRLTEIGANLDEQFIEIYNGGDDTNIAGCSLITQYGNGTRKYTFPDTPLAATAYLAIYFKDDETFILTKNPSVDRTVQIINTADQLIDYTTYNKQQSGKSWALVNGVWQSETPTPGLPNRLASDNNNDNSGDDNNNEPKPTVNQDCAKLKLSEIGANLDEQFIEVINPTDEPLNLTGCGLATNRNNAVFAFGDEVLLPSAARLVKIADSGLTLSKTVSGKVYLLAADGSEIGDVTYPEPKANTSYALIGDEWQIAKNPTPNHANTPEIVNDCTGLELSEIAANVDEQFIEITNATAHDVDLTGCQLTTNRGSATYEFARNVLVGGGYLTVKVKDTPLTLTKTTTGTVYLLASDGVREVDSTTYSNLAKDTSWALVDGMWRQTYALTPDAANAWIAYPSCPLGQERNLETGRCRKIAEPEVLAACPAGQYRNPETNRCKKYDTGSTLTPCKEGYERNPLTNRCRKIVVEEDGLKPCAEGWERNPETNRCRKKVSTAPASFAVQPGDPTGGSATYVLASAGVIAATLGIVLFQFRMEIANLAHRFRPKLVLRRLSS